MDFRAGIFMLLPICDRLGERNEKETNCQAVKRIGKSNFPIFGPVSVCRVYEANHSERSNREFMTGMWQWFRFLFLVQTRTCHLIAFTPLYSVAASLASTASKRLPCHVVKGM